MPTSKLKKFRKQSVLRMNEVNEARRRQKKGNTLMLNNTTDSCLLCHTAGTNPTTPTPNLDLNARVIFLLQKLLHVSPTVCDDLLQNYGHPADWISLCFKCNDIVVKGCKLFDQITKLEEELDSIREQVKSKVSVKEEIGEDGDREESDSATKIIRRYLVSSGFVGEESDIGVEIYPDPDVSIKVEVDESDGAIPPPDFVTHYFNLDKNEPFVLPSVEAVGVDPLAFQDDEMVEYIPSANQPPRRGRPRKQARVTQTKKGRMIGKISKPATVQDYDRDEDEKSDQDDRHNDYSDQGSLAPSAQPEPATLSWAEIMAKFPPPPPTPEDEELIPSQRHEKELERLTNLATKYNITSFPCPHCPKEMSKISYWSSHVDWCTDKTMGYKCDTCEKVVKTKEVLENHILSTHVSEEAFTCCGCNTFFRRWEYFDDHAIKNADCAKFAIFCTNAPCKIAFSSEQVCQIHSECRHSDINPFKCLEPGCGKRFSTWHLLKWHFEMHHTEGNSAVCDQCGKEFKAERSLRHHVNNVHRTREEGAPRFPCDICGREMVTMSKLIRHKQIHINPDDAPHLCTLCGKRFRLKNYLNIHMWSHDPDRREKYSSYKPKQRKRGDGEVKRGVAGARIGRPKKMEVEKATEAVRELEENK